MTELYGTIGNKGYKNLLADPQGADKITIPVKPGAGNIPAGTVMFRESTGLWTPAAAAQITAANQLVVLKEDTDAGTAPGSGKTAVASDAIAYRAGRFINGAVTLAAGAALTEAHKVILRGQNIVFDQKESKETFNNSVTG